MYLKPTQISRFGWPIVIILSTIPIIMWLFMMPLNNRIGSSYILLSSLGRITGLASIVLFAFNIILTTRLPVLENIFGGLNKMFIAHHILGGTALILALIHTMAVTVRLTSVSFRDAALIGIPFTNGWPMTFGVLGLWGFVVLMILTFYISLPYRTWLFTHKFLGSVFLLIALHTILISSDTTANPYLKWYLIVLMVITGIAYVYRTLLPRFFIRRYKYEVVNVESVTKGVVRITMLPQGKRMDFKAGQFIFVSFRIKGLSSEWHPFSISSNTLNDGLCITVKNLGNYTDNVLKHSMGLYGGEVWIEGAYGRFNFRNFHAKRQIWVAGGIGITPFLSMVPEVRPDYKVDLYYSVKTQAELIDLPTMAQWAQASNHSLRIIPFISERDGKITAERIQQISGDLSSCEVLLCGPPAMMHSIKDQLTKVGVKKSLIHAEEFALT
jgi:predicted ferric reductase